MDSYQNSLEKKQEQTNIRKRPDVVDFNDEDELGYRKIETNPTLF